MREALHEMSAGALACGVARREVSAREIAAHFLERVEQLNPAINAICTVNPAAVAEAEACDRRLQSGEKPRPLEGVPFVAKDNLQTKGLRTTFGSRLCENYVPEEDAIAIERLRGAGAVLLGKTNTPEFATDVNTTNRLFGQTRNPLDLNVTAGGSSGGTGAALAAGMAPIGLGTDLGGSIRVPSSYCGITGIRAAPGRVPVYPTDFGWDTLVEHVHGPMARTVADVGLVLSVLAGPDDRDPSSLPAQDCDYSATAEGRADLSGRRIAYSPNLNGLFPVHPEVHALTQQAARDFEALGCKIEEASFDSADLKEIIAGTRGFGMVARFAEQVENDADRMTGQLVGQVRDALKVDLRAVAKAERMRTRYWQRVRSFMERYDYILTPTVGAPPFRLDEPLPQTIGGRPVARYYDVFLATYAFSVIGLPAMSVPCGFTRGGLPVGLQIVSRRLREDRVLEAAAAYAQARPEHFKPRALSLAAPKPVANELVTPGMRFG
jgi:amidase